MDMHGNLLQLAPGLCRAHPSQQPQSQGLAPDACSLPCLGTRGGWGILHHAVCELHGHDGRGAHLLGHLGAPHARPGRLEAQPALVRRADDADLGLDGAGHAAGHPLSGAGAGQRLPGGRLPVAHCRAVRARPMPLLPGGVLPAGVAATAARGGGVRRPAGSLVCGCDDHAGLHGGGQELGIAGGDHPVQPHRLLPPSLDLHGYWPGPQHLHPQRLAGQLPRPPPAAVQLVVLPRLAGRLPAGLQERRLVDAARPLSGHDVGSRAGHGQLVDPYLGDGGH
mmetsp:Transcript_55460/g.161986  ORF Transcript_55460/g.161986 Transcript_55460/m.161986 type:complete len:280 (+) Transcript_55460:1175-2014(+)